MSGFTLVGTGMVPHPFEAVTLGISPDDHRKTRNRLKRLRQKRRAKR